jgi:hypothetical protein
MHSVRQRVSFRAKVAYYRELQKHVLQKIIHLALFLIPIITVGCVSHPGECNFTKGSDDWLHLDEKPEVIKHDAKPRLGFYHEWFKGKDGRFMLCERRRSSYECSESATYYSEQNGSYKSDSTEVIACIR